MTNPTPDPEDTGDVAAVPEDQQLTMPAEDDFADPTDLSDVSDDGDVVDVSEASGQPETAEQDEEAGAG